MNPPPPSDFDPEPDLAAEGRALRGLAGALLGGGAAALDADDLAQEAWLAAHHRPPARRAPWLRAVTRRLAGRARRTDARRRERERAAARPEARPAAVDAAARAETVALVGEALVSVREPFREALLLRFWEDLPPRAIAARVGCPVATVHSRLRRGVALLRAELERRERRWEEHLAATVGLVLPTRPVPHPHPWTTGAIAMKAKIGTAAACVVALAALGVWLAPDGALAPRPGQPPGGAPLASADPTPAPEGPGAANEGDGARAPAALPGKQPVAPPPAQVARVARVVDPTGAPATGAIVFARPNGATAWTPRPVDATGRATLPADTAEAWARAPGWAPSARVALGDRDDDLTALRGVLGDAGDPMADEVLLRLPARGARLVVDVVDADGAPLADATVRAGRESARAVRTADGRLGREAPDARATTDAAGRATFDALRPGWLRVAVAHEGHAPSTSFATLRAGDDERLEVALARGLHVEGVVRADGRPVAGAEVRRGSSDARVATSGADGAYRLGPVDAGKVVVTTADGRRAERRVSGAAGEVVRWDPELTGEPALRGVVLEPDGRPAVDARVSANLDTWPGWRRGATTDAAGAFAIHGCPEAPLRLEVERSEGNGAPWPALVAEDQRAGGPARTWTLPGGAPPVLAGTLVGAPPGQAFHLEHATDARRGRLTAGPGPRLEVAADGRFEVAGVPPGRYRLVARGAPLGACRVAEVLLEADERRDLGAIEVPRPGTLVARSCRPAGPPTAEASFLLEDRANHVRLLDLVGAFPERTTLAPGDYVLQLELTPGPQREIAFSIRPGAETTIDLDLRSLCPHRIVARYASGRAPSGPLEVRVRREDVPGLAAADATTRVEEGAWMLEVELESGRFAFEATDGAGRRAARTVNLFTSQPGREVELVIDDR